MRKMIIMALASLLISFLFSGCITASKSKPTESARAEAKEQEVYVIASKPKPSEPKVSTRTRHYAEPKIVRVDSEIFSASIQLNVRSNAYSGHYESSSFTLIVQNKSNSDLEIDWDKTLYLVDGLADGRFMFEGVRYVTRNDPKPPDIVLARTTTSKQIFPNSKVSNVSSYHNDLLDMGEIGVSLYIRNDGKAYRTNLKLVHKIKDIHRDTEEMRKEEANARFMSLAEGLMKKQ